MMIGAAMTADRACSVRIDLKPVAELRDDERAALTALTAAVYPPEVLAAGPGFRSASPEYSALVWSAEGELVSHVGLIVREGTLDGAPVRIGGIGSVKTHPRVEGRGYASAGLRRAAAALAGDHAVAFSLLVCREQLLSFYARLGWSPFDGQLVVNQPSGRMVFVANRPMVLMGSTPAPLDGVIDLKGLPW